MARKNSRPNGVILVGAEVDSGRDEYTSSSFTKLATETSISSREACNCSARVFRLCPVTAPPTSWTPCNTAASSGSIFLAVSMNAKRNDLARAGSAAAASRRAQISCSSSLFSSAAATKIGSAIGRLGSCPSTRRACTRSSVLPSAESPVVEKKLPAFSALGGGFLRFPIGDRRCKRTRASVSNAGGNARPSLTNARQLQRRRPCFIEPAFLVRWYWHLLFWYDGIGHDRPPPAVVASPGPSENPHGGSGRFALARRPRFRPDRSAI